MTCNKYFFHHRNQDFVIYAKDIPDAFIPYRRLMGNFSIDQSEFEKELISPVDVSKCFILTGNSLSVEEIRMIVNKHKVPAITPVHKVEKKVEYPSDPKELEIPVNESIKALSESQTISVKRGRGRPKGSKNKTKVNQTIDQYFET